MLRTAGVIALAVVFGVGMASCYLASTPLPGGGSNEEEEDDGDDLVDKVIFNLQDPDAGMVTHGIQDLEDGEISPNTAIDAAITPLREAGLSAITVITENGKKAFKYTTPAADWGPGIDLDNSAFGYRAGDKITITGKAEGTVIDLALNVNQNGAQNIAGGNRITEAGDFTVELVLAAADIPVIVSNQQKTIRFEKRGGAVAATVTITQILIEGKRPSTTTKLPAPVITLTPTGIEWTAIAGASGYKVFAAGNTTPVATPNAAATDVNLKNALAEGTYTITLVAVGTTGSTTDSDPSNAVTFVRDPDSFTPPAGMVVLGPMTEYTPATTQGGWAIKNAAVDAGVLPKYLVVMVDEGGDGLGGTKVILQSSTLSWIEKEVSGGWNYDGTWAAPAKVFIFELLVQYSDYAAISLTDGYINVGLRMANDNTKITLNKILSGAIVFGGTAAATKLAAVCIPANLITGTENPGNFWFIDGDFNTIFD